MEIALISPNISSKLPISQLVKSKLFIEEQFLKILFFLLTDKTLRFVKLTNCKEIQFINNSEISVVEDKL